MSETKNPGHFCWVDLASHDMKAATEWYAGVFGWSLGSVDESGPSPYGFFKNGETDVAGIGELTAEMKANMPAVWNSYVSVDDCAAVVERAKELGGEVVFDTQEVGGGTGKLAFLKDPEGAIFALWQGARMGDAARSETEAGHFCWQELATRDIDGASKFYSELFGWSISAMEGAPTAVVMIDAGGTKTGHMLKMNEEWEGLTPHWSVYFKVADTDATCAKVKESGGKVMAEPFDAPPGRIAVVADPQGATFYVISSSA